MPKVGLLVLASPATTTAAIETLKTSLRELGYVDGRTVTIEYRSAEGHAERLPALAADLVARKVDVIITGGGNISTSVAREATKTIPIVMGGSLAAVEFGFVASLARPGGNITGLTVPREVGSKQVELVRQLVPSLERVAILLRPHLATEEQRSQAKSNAQAFLSLGLDFIDVNEAGDLTRAFAAVRAARAQALLVAPDPIFFNERARVLDFARTARLPTVYPLRDFVEAGGLMSYSLSVADVYRSVARYVDRILKGAKPADLPVEQPTRYELVINLKTAKALGLTVPPGLLARADELIH